MTKILAIVGTDIRLEIEACDYCPLYHIVSGCRCGTDYQDEPPSDCPLPEKTDG